MISFESIVEYVCVSACRHTHLQTHVHSHTPRTLSHPPPPVPGKAGSARAVFLGPGHLVLGLHQAQGSRSQLVIYKVLLSQGLPWGPGSGCRVAEEQGDGCPAPGGPAHAAGHGLGPRGYEGPAGNWARTPLSPRSQHLSWWFLLRDPVCPP